MAKAKLNLKQQEALKDKGTKAEKKSNCGLSEKDTISIIGTEIRRATCHMIFWPLKGKSGGL